jgi:hypothetical protein
MPYLVAIDTIATKLLHGPWAAKSRIGLGYYDIVHLVVAKVFLLQRNATLQLGFFYNASSGCKVYYCDTFVVLPKVQLQRSVSLQVIVLLRTDFGCYWLNLVYYHESNLVAICSIV